MSSLPLTGTSKARGPASLIFNVKLRLARNYLSDIKRHIFIHVIAGFGTLSFLLLGGFFLFYFIFDFLQAEEQQPFGAPLMKRLIGMVFLAFFSMLTFSNLIIMLTTTYMSREVESYMSLPIGHRRLFFCKLAESMLYSSWAFIILSLPFIVALGRTAQPVAPWTFYPTALAIYVPFVVLPGALGAIMVLLLTAFIPAKKAFRMAVIFIGVLFFVTLAVGRQVFTSPSFSQGRREGIGRVMAYLGIGDIAWMPSTWLARAVNAALVGDWNEILFWSGLIVSASLMAVQVCYWLAGPYYYKGYCAARASTSTGRSREGGIYRFFDVAIRPLRSSIRPLVVKDLTIFWRDPAQWGQLVILFGLLLIYVANLGGASELRGMSGVLPLWQTLVSLFNIGATAFVLSILSTRFVYPMLSLEGKQQWVIGLAPLSRTSLVWVKYGVAVITAAGITVPLILLSSYVLETDLYVTVVSVATIVVMAMGLNSLAVGLGALLPNFGEDNPSRIANGLGGTLNIILSLIYIGSSVVLEAPLIWEHLVGNPRGESVGALMLYSSIGGWFALQVLVISIPMALGLRNWRNLEF